MSEEFCEISILRAEGIPEQSGSIGCYVQVDGRLHDVITPLNADNQESEVLIPSKGLLRLIVKNMGCASDVLGSVSFDLRILPIEGFQWLPLFTSMAKDQIYSLPEEVEKAKLLILINPKKDEVLIDQEKTFLDKSSKADTGIANKNGKQEKVVFEKQEKIFDKSIRKEPYVLDKKQDSKAIENVRRPQSDALVVENESMKKNLQKFKVLFEDMNKELKAAKLIIAEERKARTEVQDRVGKITAEFEENLKKAKTREDGLLKLLQLKDEEIAEQTRVISQLRTNLRNIEHEKAQIMDVISEYKTELALTNFERLTKELSMVKGLLEESESQRHKLHSLFQQNQETPCKINDFLSPISLNTLEVDMSEDFSEHKEFGSLLEDLSSKYEVNRQRYLSEDRSCSIRETVLRNKYPNGVDILLPGKEDESKSSRRRVANGFIKTTKENTKK